MWKKPHTRVFSQQVDCREASKRSTRLQLSMYYFDMSLCYATLATLALHVSQGSFFAFVCLHGRWARKTKEKFVFFTEKFTCTRSYTRAIALSYVYRMVSLSLQDLKRKISQYNIQARVLKGFGLGGVASSNTVPGLWIFQKLGEKKGEVGVCVCVTHVPLLCFNAAMGEQGDALTHLPIVTCDHSKQIFMSVTAPEG